jgi:hypothetical protein
MFQISIIDPAQRNNRDEFDVPEPARELKTSTPKTQTRRRQDAIKVFRLVDMVCGTRAFGARLGRPRPDAAR